MDIMRESERETMKARVRNDSESEKSFSVVSVYMLVYFILYMYLFSSHGPVAATALAEGDLTLPHGAYFAVIIFSCG